MGVLGWIASFRRPQPPAYDAELPTVKCDARHLDAHVADAVSAALRSLPDIPLDRHKRLREAAIRSAKRGRDLRSLTEVIERFGLYGVDRKRAAEIACFLCNRATAQIEQRRMIKQGCEQAKWLHSGADCFPQQADMEFEAAAHAAADGKKYWVTEGLSINGRHTWPGWDDGCKCVASVVVNGF